MVLNKRYGCVQRLHRLLLVLHHYLLILLLNVYVLTHHGVRAQPERQTYDKADTHLSHNLPFTFQAVFVATEYLNIVIEES